MLKAYVRIWQSYVHECCLWSGFQNYSGSLENLPGSANCSTGIFSSILRQWLSMVGLGSFYQKTTKHAHIEFLLTAFLAIVFGIHMTN